MKLSIFFEKKSFYSLFIFLFWKKLCSIWGSITFLLTWEVNFKFQIQMNRRVTSSNLIKNFVTFSSSVTLIMLDHEFESRNWNSKNSCNCLSYAITNIFWKKIFLFSINFLIWKKLYSIWRSISFFINLRSQL